MKVLTNKSSFKSAQNSVLTLGNFDGVHLGHRKIFETVKRRAAVLGAVSVVYTFDPHPLKVVSPLKSPPLICGTAEKVRLIGETGIDAIVLASFTKEFALTHPSDFVKDVIVERLRAKEVWVGYDFYFGKGRSGTIEFLKKLGVKFGFKVNVIPAYKKGGSVISSSRIRSLILKGAVGGARDLMGRAYAIKGTVVRGTDIGKTLGFPTANVKTESELIPGGGVYATYTRIKGASHPSVTNIGTAPTFGGKETAIEVHIPGLKKDLYNKKIDVTFIRRLRGEKKFKSKEALIAQIKKDIVRAEKIL